jgi:hypothetical protein
LLIRPISCWNNSRHYQAYNCFHVLREMLCRRNFCHTLQVTTLVTLKWSKSKFGSTQPHRRQSLSKIWHGMFWILVFLYDPKIMTKSAGCLYFLEATTKVRDKSTRFPVGHPRFAMDLIPRSAGNKSLNVRCMPLSLIF